MLSTFRVATGLGVAAALTVAGIAPGQAQAGPGPAYLVVELDVKDHGGFMEYAEKATQTVSQYGGTFIVLAREASAIEGAAPDGVVTIIKFDSVDGARKWLDSPEYSDVKGIRHATADTRQYLVEGVADR
jgi:uncharacterized protein (DUF1330 family)